MRRPKAPAAEDTRVGDLHDLRAFALACDLRSLTAAAAAMGESKATVSRRMARLEAALGVALLQRSARGTAPTDAGAAYRLRVSEVLGLLGDANAAAMHGGRAAPAGLLRVSAPPGFAHALAPILASFTAAHPQVTLVVHLSSRLVDLATEHFDVALRSTAALADSSLVALSVGVPPHEGLLVAAPSYVKAHGLPTQPKALASHRFLALGDSGAAFTLPLARAGRAKRLVLHLPVTVAGSDLGFLKEMVLQGAGITALPRPTVQRELDEGQLLRVLPQYHWPTDKLFLLHRGGPFVPPKIRAFLDHVRAALDHPRSRSH